MFRSRALLALVAVLVLVSPAAAGLDKSSLGTLRDEFNLEFRPVRAEFLAYPSYSLVVDDQVYACSIPIVLRRLGAAGETFRLRKVATKDDRVHVELETPGRRRVRLVAYDRGQLTQEFLDRAVSRLLHEVFAFGGDLPPQQMVGQTESRLYHLARCNHLPVADMREVFADRTAAEAQGYRPCPVCFAAVTALPFENYLGYRVAALQSLKELELLFPVATDAALSGRMQRLGRHVLDTWPLELSGFEYEFLVLHSDWLVAGALGTGLVVMSDGLLNVLETDEEVLLVLAHEIAHTELHLPPRSPVAVLADDPGTEPVSFYWARRAWEARTQQAADLLALSWFAGSGGEGYDVRRAGAALAKVQQAIGATESLVREGNQDRGLHERIRMFDPEHYRRRALDPVFVGYDGEDDPRYELRMLGIERTREFPTVYFLLTVTDYQDKPFLRVRSQGESGNLVDADGNTLRLTLGPILGVPGTSTLVWATTSSQSDFDDLDDGPLRELELWRLDGVKRWQAETREGP
ncbi:MAG: M48 family metalloprotease [Candidatus Krumholzibacteriia bacterium]